MNFIKKMIGISKDETDETDSKPLEISSPYNFKHIDHVQVDPRTSTGFTVIIIIPMLLSYYVIN